MSWHSSAEAVYVSKLQLQATSTAVQQATNCVKTIDAATNLRRDQAQRNKELVQNMRVLVSVVKCGNLRLLLSATVHLAFFHRSQTCP